MTLTAAERLDDPELLAAADPSDMLRQVASSAAQVRMAVRAVAEAEIGAALDGWRPRAIVVTGMGGSGVAGDVLAAVCGTGSPVQVLSVHDYQLPGWIGGADLVIAISCSGATQETLSAAGEAVRRDAGLICVGGAGSPLARLAEQASAPFIPVTSAGMPRSTLWGLAIPLVVVASRLGVLDVGEDAYEATAAELERISHLCRPSSESFVNPAKSLALDLVGSVPMIWGTSPLAGVAAYRFACQLNENAKYPAVYGVLPEANHNQVVAFDGVFGGGPGAVQAGPSGPGADETSAAGDGVPMLRLVLLRDGQEHPRVARRREESAQLARSRGIGVSELATSGERPLERLASLVQLIDYTTVYLAIAQGIDPGPVAAIEDLKARIA
jgi:glucose/mannose-6-phosphate isomerase